MTEKIAIIAWGAMADVLYATPIVRQIRNLHPEAYITWLIRDKFAEVIETNPDIDAVETFVLPEGHESRQDAELVMDRDILVHAHMNFDTVYDLQYWPRHSNFYERPSEDFISLRARNAKLDASAIKDRKIVCEHTVVDGQAVSQFILDNQLDGKIVTINHISYASSPVWSFENYQLLADELAKQNVRCVLTGASHESIIDRVIDARGMPYRQWKALIGCSNFYLGLDSGAKTLAASTNTPMVILHSKDFPLQKTGCGAMGIRTQNIWELSPPPSIDTVVSLILDNIE